MEINNIKIGYIEKANSNRNKEILLSRQQFGKEAMSYYKVSQIYIKKQENKYFYEKQKALKFRSEKSAIIG